MELESALTRLRANSYCLWIGAGVTKQLSLMGTTVAPDWNELTTALEAEASIVPDDATSLPLRMNRCQTELGLSQFQQAVRRLLLEPVESAIIDSWSPGQAASLQLQQLAALGRRANPIVNFNIETYSSEAIAGPWGPWRAAVFYRELGGHRVGTQQSRDAGSRFPVRVLHPHGAMDLSGLVVLTQRDYDQLNGTLALQVSVHAAFDTDLAIVGMSLDDDYLRAQLQQFRPQLRQIIWFLSEQPNQEIQRWVEANRITVVLAPWSKFWAEAQRILLDTAHPQDPPPDRPNLISTVERLARDAHLSRLQVRERLSSGNTFDGLTSYFDEASAQRELLTLQSQGRSVPFELLALSARKDWVHVDDFLVCSCESDHHDQRKHLLVVHIMHESRVAAAGLRYLDEVVRAGGETVDSLYQLQQVVAATSSGCYSIDIRRDGAEVTLQVPCSKAAELELLEATLETDPDSLSSLNSIAWVLATAHDDTVRDGPRGLQYVTRLLEANPDSVEFLDTAAAVYAELGEFPEAIRLQRRAIELTSYPYEAYLRRRLRRYEGGLPSRYS